MKIIPLQFVMSGINGYGATLFRCEINSNRGSSFNGIQKEKSKSIILKHDNGLMSYNPKYTKLLEKWKL